MVPENFNSSPLWPGDACVKDTHHCVHHSRRHQSACANVTDDKELTATEQTIWWRTVLCKLAARARGSLAPWNSPRCDTEGVPPNCTFVQRRIGPWKCCEECRENTSRKQWWTRGDSNPRPPRCERGALPAELLAHE